MCLMPTKLTDFIYNGLNVPQYKKYLDLSSLRQKLISGNIANVSTPGFKSEDIDFDSEYHKATEKGRHTSGSITHPNHIPLGNHPGADPKIMQARIESDEMNSVNIDKEMANQAQNELRYSIGAKLIQMKFNGLQKAITSK